ncbi:hypothetical protein D3C86_1894880 [compost metagenome]
MVTAIAREVRDRGDVLLRDHEDVDRRLGVDVAEGDGVIVLVDDLRRDLAGDDLAEETIGHLRHSLLRS